MKTIQDLVAARIAAKREEDAAVAKRRELDEQISLQLSTGKAEGTESLKLPELCAKVTVTYKVTRKVDTEALQTGWENLSAEQQAAFKWSAEVSVSALRKFEGNDLVTVSKFFESKPAAPSIKVEMI
jgi:hypothetical protein